MPIPDYQALMLPLLASVNDGSIYKLSDVKEKIAEDYKLTAEQRRELLPSGTQRIFDNRIAWAKT